MIVSLNARSFEKMMNGVVEYSAGFIDGVQKGKRIFFNNLGEGVIEAIGLYVDMQARADREALHHVYEWFRTGSPDARLFNLTYTVSNVGLSINSTFRQSQTVSEDGTVPFYNKAYIMENAIPVTIKPKKTALKFEGGAGEVFTKKPITVRNPGGDEVEGSFERTVDIFIKSYLKQSFLKASGLYDYLNKPTLYKKNFQAGVRSGRSKGISTGFKWITNAKIGIENA